MNAMEALDICTYIITYTTRYRNEDADVYVCRYIYIRATPGVCPGVTLTIRASTISNYHGINYHHFRVKVLGF